MTDNKKQEKPLMLCGGSKAPYLIPLSPRPQSKSNTSDSKTPTSVKREPGDDELARRRLDKESDRD